MIATTLCAVLLAQIAPGKTLVPRLAASGAESGIRKEQFYLLENAKEWQTIWTRHRNFRSSIPETAPAVDFKTEVVLGVFRGEQFFIEALKIQNYKLVEDKEKGSKIVVSCKDMGFDLNSERRERLYPFGWAILPRYPGKYEIKNLVHRMGDTPIVIAKFDLSPAAPKPKPDVPPPPKTSKP